MGELPSSPEESYWKSYLNKSSVEGNFQLITITIQKMENTII